MTRPANGCPDCGDPMAWTKCWECGWEYEPEEAATADVSPPVRDAYPTRSGTLLIVLPWDYLASDNKRKGLDPTSWRAYKAARDAAHACAMCQVDRRPHFTGPVAMSVTFHVPDRRRRDPNNLTKLICDALADVAYTDDSQIVRMGWVNAGVSDDPRAVIDVEAA